mmetsp:Transcript_9127/g.24045  ORF Transcript_9127/g.24045 Transcript_9127/m.24045 type:complete len:324 (-) Transcript_9127:2275-3246(-)
MNVRCRKRNGYSRSTRCAARIGKTLKTFERFRMCAKCEISECCQGTSLTKFKLFFSLLAHRTLSVPIRPIWRHSTRSKWHTAIHRVVSIHPSGWHAAHIAHAAHVTHTTHATHASHVAHATHTSHVAHAAHAAHVAHAAAAFGADRTLGRRLTFLLAFVDSPRVLQFVEDELSENELLHAQAFGRGFVGMHLNHCAQVESTNARARELVHGHGRPSALRGQNGVQRGEKRADVSSSSASSRPHVYFGLHLIAHCVLLVRVFLCGFLARLNLLQLRFCARGNTVCLALKRLFAIDSSDITVICCWVRAAGCRLSTRRPSDSFRV